MGTIFKSGRAGLARAATAMALAAGIASMVAVQGASASSSGPNGMRTRDAHTTSTSGGNLVNHGGPVLETSHTYAIWWGNPAAWNSSAPVALGQLLSGFNGSNYLGIAAQYMPDAKVSSAYEGARPDGSSPPSKVSPSTLGNEVGRLYGTNIDPLGIYFVYTSNFPKGGNYCAWHSYATVNGIRVAVAYMPNTTGVAGCDPQVPANTTSYNDEGINSLANVTAHEFMESITDTQPASGTYAWIDNSGSEIGDKCAWQFSSNVALSSSTVWKLQKEWDNSISGCNQGV
jgi:hypothetical protein